MPLYEYECGACGHRFEVIQKFSDAAITECPKCFGTLRKLQSAPAFQLKGTGWYATDYPKPGQTSADKNSGDSSEGSSSDKVAATGDKSDKTEKVDKTDKPNTPEKSGPTEKKAQRTEKTDKPASATGSSASGAPSKTSPKES